jgi:2-C-methyl-D-erythritol 2,4-cyclodiphosphate synthase
MRVGIGYDSHRFTTDRPLVLGGVPIPDSPGLAGHSDADAVAHALTDALLGAAGLGDIGTHFPDTDPRWRNADSLVLLEHARSVVRDAGWRLLNADVTVVVEHVRLRPYVEAMAARLAGALEVDPDAISIKAKTNEGMGFVGHGEGIAVIAVALLAQ